MSKKKKSGQFNDYKKWTTNQGFSFLAKDQSDAKLYVNKVGGNLRDLKEVLDSLWDSKIIWLRNEMGLLY